MAATREPTRMGVTLDSFGGNKRMKSMSLVGVLVFWVIVGLFSLSLVGCQTGKGFRQNKEGSAFNQSTQERPCRFG